MIRRWPLAACACLFTGLAAAQGMGGTVKALPRASAKARVDTPGPHLDFRDIAGSSGLTAPNVYGGVESKRFILEMTGNGVAVFDFDNDGLRDLFFANGEKPSGRLYRNRGGAVFEDITASAGLESAGWGQGVCAGDYDNNGFTDLLVTYYGHNVLYRNAGGKRLVDATRTAGLPVSGERWATGCAFLDYDRDGLLDIFVSNYLGFDRKEALTPGSNPFCYWKGLAVFCGPKGFPGGRNLLYRNEGGRFRDVSEDAGIRLPGLHYGLGVTVSDFDGDGWPDIYVACDSTPSILYRNNRDGSFTDMAVPAGTAYGENGQEQGGMGAAAGDFDNDGRLDIVKTNFIDETPSLYRNLGDLFFEDATYSAGLGIHTGFVGWGVEFVDVDQDGWRDIVMANGHIYPELGDAFRQRRLLYWNLRNAAFRDVTAGAGEAFQARHSSRGLASGDLDGDGAPEIVVVNMNGPPTLLRNFGERGNAILVELEGVKSNRSAIGARVTVEAAGVSQTAEVRSGSSYSSQSDFRLHFGLGGAGKVERLRIRWPGGSEQEHRNVAANASVTVREGNGIVRTAPFEPRRN